jgi:hypothetical protein
VPHVSDLAQVRGGPLPQVLPVEAFWVVRVEVVPVDRTKLSALADARWTNAAAALIRAQGDIVLVLEPGDERLDGDVRLAAQAFGHLKAFDCEPIERIVKGNVLTRRGSCRRVGQRPSVRDALGAFATEHL